MSWADGDNLSPANLNNKSGVLINVKEDDFGAVGDGATDDTAALQAAITAATDFGGTNRGVKIVLPAGVYQFNQTLNFTGHTLTLEGDGAASSNRGTVLEWTGGATPAIQVNGSIRPRLEGFSLNNTGTGTVGIDIYGGADHVQLEDIFLDPTVGFSTAGIRIGTSGVTPLLVYLRHVDVTGCAVGLLDEKCWLTSLNECRFIANTVNEAVIGGAGYVAQFTAVGSSFEGNPNTNVVVVKNAEVVDLLGCYFENDGTGFAIDIPSTATLGETVVADGCRFFGNAHGNDTPAVARIAKTNSTLNIVNSFARNYEAAAEWVTNDASLRVYLAGLSGDATVTRYASSLGNVVYGGGVLGGVIYAGYNVPSGSNSGYQVAGQQVVGARLTAISDATDAASTQARLNDLLAHIRTHGLIAT